MENQVSGNNPVNQEGQELLFTVRGTWSLNLIKMNAWMVMKDSKPALLYALLNLIFNWSNYCNNVKLIK